MARGPGADIIPALAPAPGEWVIDKPGAGMVWDTCQPGGLHSRLQAAGISRWLFTGMTTKVCVQRRMPEAKDRDYACLIVDDTTESDFPAFKRAARKRIETRGAHRRRACAVGGRAGGTGGRQCTD